MIKKILYINFSEGWGGLEIFSYNIFSLMSNAGCNIIFAVTENSPLAAKLDAEGFSHKIIKFKSGAYQKIIIPFKIGKILSKENISIIHTFKSSDIRTAVIAMKIYFLKNIRLIHHLQLLPEHPRKDLIHFYIYKHLYKLVSITRQMEKAVIKYWPVSEKKILTIYHGIDNEPFKAERKKSCKNRIKHNIPSNKTVIGIVGQVTQWKGQYLLLEVFSELKKIHSEIFLVIAGAPPKGEENFLEKIKAYIVERNLENDVLLAGFCPNIPEMMSCFDIFVLGSKNETFGLVVIEAMSSGCLVTASSAGGVPEIVTDSIDGFLYKAFDENDLYSCLKKILNLNENVKTEIIKNAENTVKSRFSIDRFKAEINELYDSSQF